jgi:hypothetical protein
MTVDERIPTELMTKPSDYNPHHKSSAVYAEYNPALEVQKWLPVN